MLRLVLDSLRYWVTEMGVDGFRFDLVTTLLRDEQPPRRPGAPLQAGAARGPGAQPGQAHRRALGHGALRLPGRRLRRGLERVERPVPQLRARLLARQHPRRRRAGPAPGRLPRHLRRRGRPRRASTSSPRTTASPCATSSPTTSSTTAPTASPTATAPTTTAPGTAASRARPRTGHVDALRHRQTQNLMATLLLSNGVPDDHRRRRAGPDPAGQQQRLLPGLPHLLGALGHRPASGPTSPT